ncbi:MAG: asparagine synthase-related protein [Natrialbaceae archaeon]|nr:asparagine synthase-related protein [Natrialbaceae archaeon]
MLRGASEATVRAALESGDPLPGTGGFGGAIDGRLVRDVLGRVPVFYSETDWAFTPAVLEEPTAVPAGHVYDGTAPVECWRLPSPAPRTDLRAAIDDLETALIETASSITDGAIAFSGGVDSALLAALIDAPLYTVGVPGSQDLETARATAAELDRSHRLIEVHPADIEAAIPEVARAIGRTNPMDVSIACSLYLLAEGVAEAGHNRLVIGQGADELFGGYAKVAHRDHRVEADSIRAAVNELIASLPGQLARDVPVIEAAELTPVAPFLHDRVVEQALALPEELLVRDGTRKVALRRIARRHLPGRVANRDKKAIQYGTLINREIDRLARQAGFKRREDDHVGRYIRSRLD